MAHEIVTSIAEPRWLAAVRIVAQGGDISSLWKPALDDVWLFLSKRKGLSTGTNFFLYHHPKSWRDPLEADIGVLVKEPFEAAGTVRCVLTPAGEIATAHHIGPYETLGGAHEAILTWCKDNDRRYGDNSWEAYGDWNDDQSKLETDVSYVLKPKG